MFAKRLLFALALAVLCVVLFIESRDFEYPTTVYINILITILGLLTLAHIFLCFRDLYATRHSDTDKLTPRQKKKLIVGIVAALAYGLLLPYVGFYTMSFIYFVSCVHFFNPNRNAKSLAIALGAGVVGVVLLYLLFSVGLQVPTPEGLLF